MTPAAQYRALVDKLQQLDELKIGDIDPATGRRITGGLTDGEGNLVGSGTPGVNWNQTTEPVIPEPTPEPQPAPEPTPVPDQDVQPGPTPAPVEKCGPEVKEKIKAQKTFNAAYAMAAQAGCDDFEWCQIVTVPGQGAMQGDAWFNAPGMGTGSVVTRDGKPTFAPVRESDELDRIREIAGTQVVEASAGGIPEIKAATKEKAIEIAMKKGIQRFRFCSKFKVQAAKKGQGGMPAQMAPSAAVVGNPNISRSTAPGNPNIRPGSLRDRAAQANAARRPNEPRF